MHAISTLLTDQSPSPEQPVQSFGTPYKIELTRHGSCNYHDICREQELRPVRAIVLAEVSFHAIAHYGATHLTRYGDAEPAALPFAPGHITHERRPHRLFSIRKYGVVFALAGEARITWEREPARQNRLIDLLVMGRATSPSTGLRSLSGQALPALAAAIANDFTAALSRHARAETVRPLPLQIRWLKRSLHDRVLNSLQQPATIYSG